MSIKIKVIQLFSGFICYGLMYNAAIAAEQRAYIGNIGQDAITTCTIEENAYRTFKDCRVHHDPTFAAPIDIVTYPSANIAYVANWNSPAISICAMDPQGYLLNQPCQSLNVGDSRINGLTIDTDHNSTKLYVSYMLTGSNETYIKIFEVATDGSLHPLTHQHYFSENGRVALGPYPNFGANNLGVYIASINQAVYICDFIGPPTGCLYPVFEDDSFVNPRSAAMDPAVNYFYAANVDSTMSICKLHKEEYTLYPCTTSVGKDSMGQSTFVFGEGVNFFIREKDNYAFIPNAGNNTISICPVDANTGAIGICHTDMGGENFDEPTSVWIVEIK